MVCETTALSKVQSGKPMLCVMRNSGEQQSLQTSGEQTKSEEVRQRGVCGGILRKGYLFLANRGLLLRLAGLFFRIHSFSCTL